MKYQVICTYNHSGCHDINILVYRVNLEMKKGWIPQGGIFAMDHAVYQAMILPDDTEEKK